MTIDLDLNAKAAIKFLNELDVEIRAMFKALTPLIESIAEQAKVPSLHRIKAQNPSLLVDCGNGSVYTQYLRNFALVLKQGTRASSKPAAYLSIQVSLDTPPGEPLLLFVGLWTTEIESLTDDGWDPNYFLQPDNDWELQGNFLLVESESKHNEWFNRGWAFAVPLKALRTAIDLQKGVIDPLIDVLKMEKTPEAILDAHKQYLYQVAAA